MIIVEVKQTASFGPNNWKKYFTSNFVQYSNIRILRILEYEIKNMQL